MLGQTVGSYKVTGKIAEGGMGVVYRAEHALLGKAAAVKVLLPELSSNQELVSRFFNEARAASTIRHPGIVEIFDFGYLATGAAFIVMEFLDGEPLSRRLATRGRLDERTALTLLRGMAGALAAAHAKGIVHRDLKPDNVYLVPDPDMPGGERPKLLDFGIAKLTDGPGAASMKTRTGAVMGTPTYMSPEQCKGAGQIDDRSDLYALGCILYEMLTGRPPFVCEGLGELIAAHMLYPPDPPTQHVPELSAWVESLVLQLLAKQPGDRIQTAGELARLLGQGSAPHLAEQLAGHGASVPTSPRLPTGSSMAMRPTPPPSQGPLPTPWPGQPPTARPGEPTTLSGAAGVNEPPKRSRTGLFAAIAAFAVIGGVVAVVLASGGGGKAGPAAAPASGSELATPPPPAPLIDAAAAAVAVPTVPVDAGTAPTVAEVVVDAGAAAATPDKPRDRDRDRDRKGKGKGKGSGSGTGVAVPIEDDI